MLLRNARAALFPNNTLAPPRIVPSPAEQLLIRRRCAQAILLLIPAKVQETYFGFGGKDGPDRAAQEIEETLLDIFGDSYCNKHLLYGIVELAILRLMPELAEKRISELLGERLG
ncbi:hypothetical protein F5884DRAFT_747354 [Xylogone sp. PMI_703]|nr:hypothetical protein F5884DRAFT_747354 [Xylogone sp. PMI_703]